MKHGLPLMQRTAPGPNGCIEWQGALLPDGYGIWRRKGEERLIHRAAWVYAHGPIPNGLLVCHHCDNRRCVNVEHLFLGTHADNQADKVMKGRNQVPIGSAHHRARLNEKIIPVIRQWHQEGVSISEIARRLLVSNDAIRSVLTGKSWRHVT